MFHTTQSGFDEGSTFSTTGLWKVILLSFYYHHFLRTSKLRSIDSIEAILELLQSCAISLEVNGYKIPKISRSGPAESNELTLGH